MSAPVHSIAKSILPGELVFDIGANLGEKTAWFADRGARVVAVEPQPNIVRSLRERFVGNSLITIVPKGVADKVGTLKMNVSENHFVSTFSDEWKRRHFDDDLKNETILIDVTTLDDLIEQYGLPRFAKIDVEGYERVVIKGLSKKIAVLSFEYDAETLKAAEEICERLKSLGFKYFNASFGELPEFVRADRWTSANELLSTLRVQAEADPMNWGDIYAT